MKRRKGNKKGEKRKIGREAERKQRMEERTGTKQEKAGK